ncbi:hypothetical protein [Calycomorphotria hydatis]|uniref:YHS domain protein n=1 Tax=Calycomorphotria hydatis TaxID=2528027 RepID=A0A517TCR1_9PLAN|nr:hypothetical protein [Calycomorphotria hydatis]QDT66151.1 YHS domain protein [Calycomorphotria hydatis]
MTAFRLGQEIFSTRFAIAATMCGLCWSPVSFAADPALSNEATLTLREAILRELSQPVEMKSPQSIIQQTAHSAGDSYYMPAAPAPEPAPASKSSQRSAASKQPYSHVPPAPVAAHEKYPASTKVSSSKADSKEPQRLSAATQDSSTMRRTRIPSVTSRSPVRQSSTPYTSTRVERPKKTVFGLIGNLFQNNSNNSPNQLSANAYKVPTAPPVKSLNTAPKKTAAPQLATQKKSSLPATQPAPVNTPMIAKQNLPEPKRLVHNSDNYSYVPPAPKRFDDSPRQAETKQPVVLAKTEVPTSAAPKTIAKTEPAKTNSTSALSKPASTSSKKSDVKLVATASPEKEKKYDFPPAETAKKTQPSIVPPAPAGAPKSNSSLANHRPSSEREEPRKLSISERIIAKIPFLGDDENESAQESQQSTSRWQMLTAKATSQSPAPHSTSKPNYRSSNRPRGPVARFRQNDYTPTAKSSNTGPSLFGYIVRRFRGDDAEETSTPQIVASNEVPQPTPLKTAAAPAPTPTKKPSTDLPIVMLDPEDDAKKEDLPPAPKAESMIAKKSEPAAEKKPAAAIAEKAPVEIAEADSEDNPFDVLLKTEKPESKSQEEENPFDTFAVDDSPAEKMQDEQLAKITSAKEAEQQPKAELPKMEVAEKADSVKTSPKREEPAKLKEEQEATPQDQHRSSMFARLAERSGLGGYQGFCPVELRDNRNLIDALPEFVSVYQARTYEFSSAAAKARFEANPERYAPINGGHDVVLTAAGELDTEGSLRNAVWYKDRLYMFRTNQTLNEFNQEPGRFEIDE